jgi:hypothetical protein
MDIEEIMYEVWWPARGAGICPPLKHQNLKKNEIYQILIPKDLEHSFGAISYLNTEIHNCSAILDALNVSL